ncbi:Ribonuclease H2, subunit C [Dillenia turbinata]|uniref:Ribonuclease H2, subunit C n=1 Tax=Dillenia turbinata TaxID=194707 RepID=A0AAN8VF61_9MAGN
MLDETSESQGTINLCSSAPVDLTNEVHQLPCCIKYSGPSAISHYFKPRPAGIEIEGLAVEEAYFRGRKLQGTTVMLPEGFCGYVLGRKVSHKRKASQMSEGNSNCWEPTARFQNITCWNHDSLPSHDDAFLRSFHWLAVSKALHKPVTPEDLESVSITKELE